MFLSNVPYSIPHFYKELCCAQNPDWGGLLARLGTCSQWLDPLPHSEPCKYNLLAQIRGGTPCPQRFMQAYDGGTLLSRGLVDVIPSSSPCRIPSSLDGSSAILPPATCRFHVKRLVPCFFMKESSLHLSRCLVAYSKCTMSARWTALVTTP